MAVLSQLPDEVDLLFVAGDTFRIRVRVIDPATGTPITINPVPGSPGEPGEYTFCAQIAKADDRTKIVSEFSIDPDPDNTSGAVILTLPPSETDPLPLMGDGDVFNGLWDLEVKFPLTPGQTEQDIRTVAQGTVTCYIDVSHCPPGTPGPD